MKIVGDITHDVMRAKAALQTISSDSPLGTTFRRDDPFDIKIVTTDC